MRFTVSQWGFQYSYNYPEGGVDMHYGLLGDRFFNMSYDYHVMGVSVCVTVTVTRWWVSGMSYGYLVIGCRYVTNYLYRDSVWYANLHCTRVNVRVYYGALSTCMLQITCNRVLVWYANFHHMRVNIHEWCCDKIRIWCDEMIITVIM